MSAYILLYFLALIISVYLWFIVYKRYKRSSWIFFFLCTIFASLWCVFYFLSLSSFIPEYLVVYISRLAFFSSTTGMYSFLFFIIFFSDQQKNSIPKNKLKLILSIFFIIFSITVFSPLVIKWMTFSSKDLIYREIYGIFYPIYVILYVMFLPLALYFSKKQIQKQTDLNKIRLKKILYWSLFFVLIWVIFQVILPIFWIWIFEKELIFFFVIFVMSVVYAIQRYFFLDIWYWIWKIVIWSISMVFSLIWIKSLHLFYSNIWFHSTKYWYISEWYSSIDIIMWIIIFLISYNILAKNFLWNTLKAEFKNTIHNLEQNISTITNFLKLRKYLKNEIQKIFKTNFCEIKLFENSGERNELQIFFEKNPKQKYFINDIVFIEEKKKNFNKKKLLNCIDENSFLIFPIFNSEKQNIWIFSLWKKSFWDFYNIDEINTIKKFIFFLEYHIKYIKTYEQIEEFSLTLDKKVDEKTIEYNNLINKQKEFISMISHEIRSPISSAVFHADSIIDDLSEKNFSKEKIKSELEILNNILIKIWELSTKLFSVQYYDTNSITLYKEQIQINNLIQNEVDIYSHLNENISFECSLDKKINFLEIDKIQFQQVIENILTNAIKFINKENWIIIVQTKKESKNFVLTIEDNWKWFEWISIEDLFDKYTKWIGGFTWLWMWLYLCKKIVEMHNWVITAEVSEKLKWAKIKITIPLN